MEPRKPNLRRRRNCSRQSNRDNLTVEAARKPAAAQFCKATSVAERGCAEVTAATTTSAASVQSTKTGRSFEAEPLVKGISASQNSPDRGIVVKSLVLRGVAVEEGTVITYSGLAIVGGWPKDFKLLAAAINPDSQFNEIFQGQLLDGMLDFINLAHDRKITLFP